MITIDLRVAPRAELKALAIGDRYIDEDGQMWEVTEVVTAPDGSVSIRATTESN